MFASDGEPKQPLIEQAVEPTSKADQRRLNEVLARMAAEDPRFTVHTDSESGQMIMRGMDELHMSTKIDVLRKDYKVEANIGAPQVVYRETLGCKADVDHIYKKQIGGAGQFARVRLLFEPSEEGSGFVFESAATDEVFPGAFIPGVLKGLEVARENGLVAGFKVIDFKASLIDGAFHDLDSSVLAFELAARGAFRELREKASPKLLEPIMKVEVLTPEKHIAKVVGDLNALGGQVQYIESRGDVQLVTAFVPLARMFGYTEHLHVISEGLAESTISFARYAPVEVDPETGPQLFPPAAAMRA